MKKKVSDIIIDVRVVMDEVANNDSDFVGGQDNDEMNDIIRQKIRESVDFIHGNAVHHLVDFTDESIKKVKLNKDSIGDEEIGGTGNITSDFRYEVRIPDDYHRFLQGVMVNWSEFVTDLIHAGDADFVKVQDKYSGASVARPAITFDGRQFKFFKGLNGDDTATLIYLPYCTYDADNDTDETEVSINRPLYAALLYHIAGLVLITYGEQRADDMFNQSLSLIGVNGAKE